MLETEAMADYIDNLGFPVKGQAIDWPAARRLGAFYRHSLASACAAVGVNKEQREWQTKFLSQLIIAPAVFVTRAKL